APESAAYHGLASELEEIEREWNADLAKSRGHIPPERIPEPSGSPNVPEGRRGRPKRQNRAQLKPVAPAPILAAGATEALYRRMRRAAARYLQARLIELCPPSATIARAQAKPRLHELCCRVYHDAIGTETRDAAHVEDRDAERALLRGAH